MAIFRNRTEAGRRLAQHLHQYAGDPSAFVLALPRGGVPVAYEVAQALASPLDVFIVRKLGVPGQPELAMGAIASGGIRVVNHELVRALGIDEQTIDVVASAEQEELERRARIYRGSRPPPDVAGRTVVLIDDGLATGATMRAAVKALRQRKPAQIVVAVPVAAPETCAEFGTLAEKTVCAATPEPFMGVGIWYEDFRQTRRRGTRPA